MDEASLRDYVLYTIVGSFIRGNFTPTSNAERLCHDEQTLPYFIPKHNRAVRSKHKRTKFESDRSDFESDYSKFESDRSKFKSDYAKFESDGSKFESDRSKFESDYLTFDRTGGFDGYYFRPKFRNFREERSVYRTAKSLRYRRRFSPGRIVSGSLEDRRTVLLQWSISDAVHIEEDANVVFR